MRKPASAQESLSHWTICRPSIAAGTTGQTSISGSVEITIPPGCWEEWRGRPRMSSLSHRSARQRGSAARSGPSAAIRSRSISAADSWKPTVLATRSISAGAVRDLGKALGLAPRGR